MIESAIGTQKEIDKNIILSWIKKNRFRMDTTYGKCWEWAIIENDFKKFIKEF